MTISVQINIFPIISVFRRKNSDNVSLLVKEDKIVNFVQNIYATFHPLVYTVSVSVKSFRISFKNV